MQQEVERLQMAVMWGCYLDGSDCGTGEGGDCMYVSDSDLHIV